MIQQLPVHEIHVVNLEILVQLRASSANRILLRLTDVTELKVLRTKDTKTISELTQKIESVTNQQNTIPSSVNGIQAPSLSEEKNSLHKILLNRQVTDSRKRNVESHSGQRLQ